MASPNLLLDETAASQILVGDITYLPVRGGRWRYLATFQDKLTKRIVGWKVSNKLEKSIVIGALKNAIVTDKVSRNSIVHTDRGSQYVSADYRKLLKRHGLRQSMSRKGNCYDNAQAESFFSRFKLNFLKTVFLKILLRRDPRPSATSKATIIRFDCIRVWATKAQLRLKKS